MTAPSDVPARARAPGRRGLERFVPALVVVVCALGAVLFFWTRSDMWLDEALAVNIARLPFGDMRAALERDGAPPLYYALLHVWTAVFGDGDLGARSLSGVAAIGAAVALWFAARRMAGSRAAVVAVLLFVSNPYAIRYATEARMYMLEILLVACGVVAVPWALERPVAARLAVPALLTALLVHTQYWALYLLAVVGGSLAVVAWRDRARRAAAVRVLVALALGAATFALWVPTFLSQREHTGTPWGDPVFPGIPIGETFLGFSGGNEQEGWLLLLLAVPLLTAGVFGATRERFTVELDLRVRPEARWPGFVGGATLVLGTTASYVAAQAFEPRYSAIVFPFFVLLVARGVTTIGDRAVQAAVVAVVVALGFVGGARNATEQRTQAGQVAAVLAAEARPEDLVVYCPDQLGPAVHRLLPAGLDEVTYAAFGDPAFVDWVDYQDRLDAADSDRFGADVLARADGATLWYVTGPGYETHRGICEAMSDAFAAARERIVRVLPQEEFFEKPGLQQFPVATTP